MYKNSDPNTFKEKVNVNDIKNIIFKTNTTFDVALPSSQTPNKSTDNPEGKIFRHQPSKDSQNQHLNQHINHKDGKVKKLSLKDYIQLNSLERKNKSRSSLRNNKTELKNGGKSMSTSL